MSEDDAVFILCSKLFDFSTYMSKVAKGLKVNKVVPMQEGRFILLSLVCDIMSCDVM